MYGSRLSNVLDTVDSNSGKLSEMQISFRKIVRLYCRQSIDPSSLRLNGIGNGIGNGTGNGIGNGTGIGTPCSNYAAARSFYAAWTRRKFLNILSGPIAMDKHQ